VGLIRLTSIDQEYYTKTVDNIMAQSDILRDIVRLLMMLGKIYEQI